MRRSDKPYKFRQIKGRAISVEFQHMPGKRISTGCYDIPSAVLWAEQYLKEDGFEKTATPTLEVFAKDFFMRTDADSFRQRIESFGKKNNEAYYKQRQGILNNYIIPRFGSYLVTSISVPMIESFLISLRRKDGETMANETKNRVLVTLRYVMADVKRKGYRPDNPAEDVSMFAKVNKKERKPLPDDAIATLFPSDIDERVRIWGGEMWAVYFSIFYDTGMRPGEIAALRVSDIRSSEHGLSVMTMKEVNSVERRVVERVKTSDSGRKRRGGLLYHDTAELLIRYIENNGLRGDDLLFQAPKLGILTTPTSLKRFKAVLRKHGIMDDDMVQYCLRHNYETDRRGDLSDDALALSMGHMHLRDDYDHQDDTAMARRLEAVRGELFRNRERRGQESDIIPLEEALRRKKEREPRGPLQGCVK